MVDGTIGHNDRSSRSNEDGGGGGEAIGLLEIHVVGGEAERISWSRTALRQSEIQTCDVDGVVRVIVKFDVLSCLVIAVVAVFATRCVDFADDERLVFTRSDILLKNIQYL